VTWVVGRLDDKLGMFERMNDKECVMNLSCTMGDVGSG
jgi:hypothetical protein